MKKGLGMLSIALLASAVTAGVHAQTKTLVYCSEASPEGFNPQLFTTGTTFDASAETIFDRLVEFKPGTTNIEPGLAKSWDISEDGKTYTFHLRKGVQFQTSKSFSPTRDFDADDVIFSFERMLDKKNPYHDVSGGNYEYFDGMGMNSLIKKIVKVDKYTVKFELSQPNAPFLADMAMSFASIFSAQQADKLLKAGTPGQLDQDPVGTGPFTKVAYRKDSVIRYVANKHYWRGAPKIDRLVFSITPDASVRYAKLKAGECQIMPYPNPADLKDMASNPNIKLLHKPGLNIGYLSFNVTHKPFDNVKVRQALNYAVNKKAIINAIYQGAGEMAKNPIPPTMWSYNEAIKDYPYDPAKAKELLKEAGVSHLNTNIWAMPVQRPYNPNARRMAEMIQADWKNVGVNAKIVTYEWGEYLKRARQGEDDTALMGWTGDNGDPDNFLNVLLSCDGVGNSNYSEWCYKPFDNLIQKAARLSDKAQRTKLYEQAQVIFKQQAPWITIAHSVVYEPIRKNVHGYKIDPFGLHYFYGVSLD
ncbi:ABC transporter substrate-binding protein [Celerinatantimonas yamalensis]|uniref:ABC transporter substrate-binding protein n=1 Tax=Celerinatantimonas yamalensis TaxID=559956 RepID=A0ABW9GBH9_9GAMM